MLNGMKLSQETCLEDMVLLVVDPPEGTQQKSIMKLNWLIERMDRLAMVPRFTELTVSMTLRQLGKYFNLKKFAPDGSIIETTSQYILREYTQNTQPASLTLIDINLFIRMLGENQLEDLKFVSEIDANTLIRNFDLFMEKRNIIAGEIREKLNKKQEIKNRW